MNEREREREANYLERSLTQFLDTQGNNSLEITETDGNTIATSSFTFGLYCRHLKSSWG